MGLIYFILFFINIYANGIHKLSHVYGVEEKMHQGKLVFHIFDIPQVGINHDFLQLIKLLNFTNGMNFNADNMNFENITNDLIDRMFLDYKNRINGNNSMLDEGKYFARGKMLEEILKQLNEKLKGNLVEQNKQINQIRYNNVLYNLNYHDQYNSSIIPRSLALQEKMIKLKIDNQGSKISDLNHLIFLVGDINASQPIQNSETSKTKRLTPDSDQQPFITTNDSPDSRLADLSVDSLETSAHINHANTAQKTDPLFEILDEPERTISASEQAASVANQGASTKLGDTSETGMQSTTQRPAAEESLERSISPSEQAAKNNSADGNVEAATHSSEVSAASSNRPESESSNLNKSPSSLTGDKNKPDINSQQQAHQPIDAAFTKSFNSGSNSVNNDMSFLEGSVVLPPALVAIKPPVESDQKNDQANLESSTVAMSQGNAGVLTDKSVPIPEADKKEPLSLARAIPYSNSKQGVSTQALNIPQGSKPHSTKSLIPTARQQSSAQPNQKKTNGLVIPGGGNNKTSSSNNKVKVPSASAQSDVLSTEATTLPNDSMVFHRRHISKRENVNSNLSLTQRRRSVSFVAGTLRQDETVSDKKNDVDPDDRSTNATYDSLSDFKFAASTTDPSDIYANES